MAAGPAHQLAERIAKTGRDHIPALCTSPKRAPCAMIRLAMEHVHPRVVDALTQLQELRNSTSGGAAAASAGGASAGAGAMAQPPLPHLMTLNAAAQEAVAAGWPLLRASDWRVKARSKSAAAAGSGAAPTGSGKPPLVAMIYALAIGMSAQDWLSACCRLLGTPTSASAAAAPPAAAAAASASAAGASGPAQRVSPMTGEPVPFSFRIVLNEMRPIAQAAVDAGRGDSVLWALYVGQEHKRVIKNLFTRAWAHLR